MGARRLIVYADNKCLSHNLLSERGRVRGQEGDTHHAGMQRLAAQRGLRPRPRQGASNEAFNAALGLGAAFGRGDRSADQRGLEAPVPGDHPRRGDRIRSTRALSQKPPGSAPYLHRSPATARKKYRKTDWPRSCSNRPRRSEWRSRRREGPVQDRPSGCHKT